MKQIREDYIKKIVVVGVALAMLGASVVEINSYKEQRDRDLAEKSAQVTELKITTAEAERRREKLENELNVANEQLQQYQQEVDRLKAQTSRGGSRGGQKVKMVVEATAYNPTNLNVSSGTGLAADGKPALPYKTVAVDPDVIPFGSIVHVPGWGTGIAHETGSAIIGNKIDVAMASDSEAYEWGRKDVEITVEYPR